MATREPKKPTQASHHLSLEKVLARASENRTDPEPWLEAAKILEQMGNIPDAIIALEQVVARKPGAMEVRKRLARLFYQRQEYNKSIVQYQYLLSNGVIDAETILAAAATLMSMNELIAARKLLLQGRDRYPEVPQIWSSLGLTLKMMGFLDQAIEAFEKSLSLQDITGIRVPYAFLLLDAGRWEDSEAQFARLKKAAPAHAAIGYACLHERRGEIQKALHVLTPYLGEFQAYPSIGAVYARLCLATRCPEKALPIIEKQLTFPLAVVDRSSILHYRALLQDALGKHSLAFQSWQESHNLRSLGYVKDVTEKYARDIQNIFQGPFWEEARSKIAPLSVTARPVFLVGIPRSGTSLTEQILGCHPQVFPAGELDNLRRLGSELSGRIGPPFPQCMASLSQVQEKWPIPSELQKFWPEVSAQYTVVTDKTPSQTLLLGMAALLFPQARVIWCRRDPLDTGLSCFQQNFASHFPWAHRVEDIAHWWLVQEQMRLHWKKHLPLPIYELDYEELVSNPATEIPKLVEFCGLPWDEACLHPEKNTNLMRTASYEQVRHPISPRSVGRWRRYEKEMEPMKKALEQGLLW